MPHPARSAGEESRSPQQSLLSQTPTRRPSAAVTGLVSPSPTERPDVIHRHRLGRSPRATSRRSAALDPAPARKRVIKSSTEDWIRQYLSGRSNPERGNWWSDDSAEELREGRIVTERPSSGSEGPARSSLDRARTQQTRLPGPSPPPPSAVPRSSSAAGMLASKYADPPAPPPPPPKDSPGRTSDVQRSPTSVKSPVRLPGHAKRPSQSQDGASSNPTVSPLDSTPTRRPSLPRAAPNQPSRKRVPWKGKTCVISLPYNDIRGVAGGAPKPLTGAEVAQRLRRWEDAGFDVRGFGHWGDRAIVNGGEGVGQSRLIYPDPEHWQAEQRQLGSKVNIPDRREWEAYVNRLKEEKLRALGVSFGDEPPNSTVSPTPSAMGRQSSSQHPPLAFSPPPLPSSAASGNTALNQNLFSPMMASASTNASSRLASVASPVLQQSARVALAGHRSSISFAPGDARFASPLHQPRPSISPLPGNWLPQQAADVAHATRVISPQSVAQYAGPVVAQVTPVEPSPRRSNSQPRRNPDAYSQGPPPQMTSTVGMAPPIMVPAGSLTSPEIVTPIPRGHRHNVSESLQKEIDAAEYHLEDSIQRQLDAVDGFRTSSTSPFDTSDVLFDQPPPPTVAKAPPPGDSQPHPDDSDKTALEPVNTSASVVLHHPQPHNRAHSLSKQPFVDRPPPSGKTSKLNVEAKEFQFGGGVSFAPGNFSFAGNHFQPAASFSVPLKPTEPATHPPVLAPRASKFNVEAAEFKPGGTAPAPSFPSSKFDFDFQFSSTTPSFRPNAPEFKPASATAGASAPTDAKQPPVAKIFDPDLIVKPPKASNAVPIVRPDRVKVTTTADSADEEDETGRITQSDARHKRMRPAGGDGDDVPQFATPTHPLTETSQNQSSQSKPTQMIHPLAGKENAAPELPSADAQPASSPPELRKVTVHGDASEPGEETAETEDTPRASSETAVVAVSTDTGDSDKDMQELSVLQAELDALEADRRLDEPSLAEAFEGPSAAVAGVRSGEGTSESDDSFSDSTVPSPIPPRRQAAPAGLERSRFADVPSPPALSPSPATTLKPTPVPQSHALPSDRSKPTASSTGQAAELKESRRPRSLSPWHASVPSSPATSPTAVAAQAALNRSPGPSPEGRTPLIRDPAARPANPPSPFPLDGLGLTHLAYGSPVHRLNTTEDLPASDWDDLLSPSEEHKVPSRSQFFDHRIDGLVGGLLEARIQPLEKLLRTVQETMTVLASDRSTGRGSKRHASADVMESDADDEDDDATGQVPFQPRARSPRKDRSLERIKNVVLEALTAHQATATAVPSTEPSPEERREIPPPARWLSEVRGMMEDVVTQHASAATSREVDQTSKDHSLLNERVTELQGKLSEATSQAQDATRQREAADRRLDEVQQSLRAAQEESVQLRKRMEEKEQKLRTIEDKRHQDMVQTQMRSALLEGAQENLQKKAADLSVKNVALENSLREARQAQERHRAESERVEAGNREVRRTMESIKVQMEESIRVREGLRAKFERIQNDMATASRDFTREQASWRKRDEEHRVRQEVLSARLEAEGRTRERLEREIERLEAQELEGMRLRVQTEHLQKSNAQLTETINSLRAETVEHEKTAARYEAEFHRVRDAGQEDLARVRSQMQAEVEAARKEAEVTRGQLEAAKREAEVSRGQVEAVKKEAEVTRVQLEGEFGRERAELANARERTLQEKTAFEQHHSRIIEDHRQTFEQRLADLQQRSERDLQSAAEDRQRMETHLLERISLSGAKNEHLEDKVKHLEEKLGVAKSAAHAAAQAAQSAKVVSNGSATAPAVSKSVAPSLGLPEKVSPQALRESILVLQEQLQAREGRIEKLEQDLSAVDLEAPNKIRERDTEIAWLRELLAVRVGELESIINDLSQEDYDGEAVKEAAIRLRANLQMEQQERERAMAGGSSLPTLASISAFASPKLPLAAAWGSWQRGRDASLGKLSDLASRGMQTPSRSSPSTQSFLSGLLTPPNTTAATAAAATKRQTPLGTGASRRTSRSSGTERARRGSSTSILSGKQQGKQAMGAISLPPPPSTPPLLRRGSYDDDAEEDSTISTRGFYDDDDGSTVDGHPGEIETRLDRRGGRSEENQAAQAAFGPRISP